MLPEPLAGKGSRLEDSHPSRVHDIPRQRRNRDAPARRQGPACCRLCVGGLLPHLAQARRRTGAADDDEKEKGGVKNLSLKNKLGSSEARHGLFEIFITLFIFPCHDSWLYYVAN